MPLHGTPRRTAVGAQAGLLQLRLQAILLVLFASVALSPLKMVHSASKCFVTDAPPTVPYGLDLCYMYSQNTCCLSGFDQEIKTAYSAMVPNGQGCGAGSQRIYASLYALREYLCLPCNPKEPEYRFESVKGDIVDGGVVPPSRSSVAGEQTWRVCRSFLYGKRATKQGVWGDGGSRYAQCGIIVSSCTSTPVFNMSTATFMLPSASCTATSELLLPSDAFGGNADPALTMLARVPQSMPDFQIVVVDDEDPNYNYERAPCFGRDSVPFAGMWMTRCGWCVTAVLLLFLLESGEAPNG